LDERFGIQTYGIADFGAAFLDGIVDCAGNDVGWGAPIEL
jgi:hypothetical protein